MRVDRLRAHGQGRGRLEAQQLLSPGATLLGRPGQLQCLRPGIRLTRSPAARTVRQRPLRHNPECSADRTPTPTRTQGEPLQAAHRWSHRTQVSGGLRIPHPQTKQASPRRYQRRSPGTTALAPGGPPGTRAALRPGKRASPHLRRALARIVLSGRLESRRTEARFPGGPSVPDWVPERLGGR